MSFDAHDDRKVGKDIIERLVGGLRDKMFIYMDQYRQTGNDDYILEILAMPGCRRSRINNCVSIVGQPALVGLINSYATITAADMEEELSRLETQATNLKAQLDGGSTIAEIADIIEANLVKGPLEKIKEYFQYEENYIDINGNNRRPV
jgi:hypothetical protein